MARPRAGGKASAWHISIALVVVVAGVAHASGTGRVGSGGRGGAGGGAAAAAAEAAAGLVAGRASGGPGRRILRLSGGGSRGGAGFGEEQMFEGSVLTPARHTGQQHGDSMGADGVDVDMMSPMHASSVRGPAGGDGVALAEGAEGGNVAGGEWDEDDLNVEQELWNLEKELDEVHEAKAIAEKVNMQLKTALETQHMEIELLRAKINVTEKEKSVQDGTAAASAACAKCVEQKRLITVLCDKLEAKTKEIQTLFEEREKDSSVLMQAKKELRQTRLRLTQVVSDLEKVQEAGGEGVRLVWRCKGQLSSLAEEVVELRERNERLEAERRVEEIARRRLHNTVQELKGNIRVYCRVRPLLGDHERFGGAVVNAADQGRGQGRMSLLGETLELLPVEGRRLDGTRVTGGGGHSFTFDRVFTEDSGQQEVFQEIAALVQSALDGYRVCIFAYGQTGSGKTYTMSAPQRSDMPGELDVHSDARGVIPRAVDMIFQEVRRLKERGWTHQVEVSFVEIYNEALRDLLCVGGSEQKRLDIKHVEGGDGGKVAQVTNLKVVQVTSAEEVTDLLVAASRMRATASTRSNEQSSRSHSVFVMHVRGWHEATGEVCDGQLNLIDLAGSERMEKGSRAEQQEGRIKETQAINKSLSSLCDVISALANKEQHVPFRNSKLTYLLQPSLGGDSKCLMFVNVSPARIHFHETLCSLRFASKVSSVQLRK